MGFGIEHIPVPHAEGGRAFAEINQNIENGAGGDPYKLALGGKPVGEAFLERGGPDF